VADLDFGALVAAVPHDDECANRAGYERQGTGCVCRFRDARIGRGIAAVEQMAFNAGMQYQASGEEAHGSKATRPERARAFEEASR
jgi:hypothetical protein